MSSDGDDAENKKSIKRINKSTVDEAPLPPKGARTLIWDTDVKGFGLRVTSNGTRTYILKYIAPAAETHRCAGSRSASMDRRGHRRRRAGRPPIC